MKRDLEFSFGDVSLRTLWRSPPVWAVAFAVIGILLVHWPTAASIVAIWIRSETFAHGFVIVPISIWLAWRNRRALGTAVAQPWWPGLALVALAGSLWLVASAAEALGIKQFALLFMLQAAIVTVVGLRAARVLVFPLAFLLFAVPAGEFLVPTLVDWTADFTVNALRLSGVPVYREANQFVIPSGSWSVVDACSGIRYAIASVMVGTIYAALAYRSARRRAAFVAASILVPIVANWFRAYMIVMIGHLSNNKFAAGVDHLIYGWIFFGLVMLLLFWIGSFWQERDAPTRGDPTSRPEVVTGARAPARPLFAAALAAIVATLVWLPLDAVVHRSIQDGVPVLPAVAAANGWHTSGERITDWKPRYAGYATEFAQTYSSANQDVGLYIAYYRHQAKGHELVTSGNSLTAPEDWNWKITASDRDQVLWNGRAVSVDRVELVGRTVRLEAFRLYWIADQVTSSPYMAKALQAWSKLTAGGDDAALIVMYAPIRSRDDGARQSLREFAAAMAPSIEHALAAARESAR
jgi:exosortase A